MVSCWVCFWFGLAPLGHLGQRFLYILAIFQLDFQVPFWRCGGVEGPAAVVCRTGGGNPSEIPGKGILKEDLIRLAASLGLARRILRLRPCRRPLLETGGCMMFDVFWVTLGAGGIVLASIWVLWMALG